MIIPTKSHVAILSSPGLGHLTPIVELAKRLVSQHELTITIFAVVPMVHKAEDELLSTVNSSWPGGHINYMMLPIEKQEFPSNLAIFSRVLAMMRSAFPALRAALSVMENKPVAMVVDQFGTEAIEAVGRECNILKYYLFFASNAMFLSFNLFLPHVDKEVNRDEPFYIPGCEPIMGEDLLDLTFSPSESGYRDFVNVGVTMTTVDGILVNTWEGLESKTLVAFRDDSSMKPIVKAPVNPIGPLVKMTMDEPTNMLNTQLMNWLDDQPNESVVYVSFGSGGTISTQQTIELAWGLELSKQRFIWVMRPPIENNSAASLFKLANDVDGFFKYLPEGFIDRTSDVGYVLPLWAPQEEILSHPSVGAFVSHCGWNSTLESIVNGVPIIAWPLYAEQNMNATMLVEQLGIGVRPEVKQPSKKLVERNEIARLLTRVMVDEEGKEIRSKVHQYKASAKKALREEGSSYNALSMAVENILG